MLTFVSNRDGNDEIYVADWEGANQRRLTNNTAVDGNPSFSPDGKQIVFFSEAGQKPDNSNLFTVNTAGGEPTRLTSFSGRNTTPRWSPDGSKILFSTDRSWPGWDICTWNIRGRTENCILSGRQSYCRGEWSHSGKSIAYSFGSFKQVDIGILDLESQATSTVSSLENREHDVAWSPDDTYLLFTGEDETPEVFHLFITDTKKEKAMRLMDAPYSIRYPTWSGVKTRDLELKKMRLEQGSPPPTPTSSK
jgi:TolB protein